MTIYSRLKKLRKEAKLSQKQVAEQLGIRYQVYQRWENGKVEIRDKGDLIKLANIFNTTVEYITDTEILPKYQKLNDNRKEKAIHFVSKQFEEQQKENNIILFNNSLVGYPVLSDQALSAGKGNGISDDMSTYTVYWTKEVNCDYGVPIKGDSMKPDYHDKDIALIQEQPCPDYEGQVCAVLDLDRGVSYIKCVTIEDEFLRLVSLNRSVDDEGNLIYEDILLPRDETIKILGKVIESFTPVKKKEL
jgi:Predicted transcriptional regulator